MALRAGSGAELRRGAGRRAVTALGLTALYAAAALLSAWPGLGSFRSAYLAGGSDGWGEAAVGDHGQVVFRFWLFGHRLAALEAPWRDPYSFQPLVEPTLVLGGWPFGLPFWPLHAAFGPVVAWNVLLLATIVAGGLLTYAWLRALALPALPAALGGLAFAIAPYRLAQSSDHLLGWVAIFLPLALLAIERSRAAEGPRARHAWGAVAALAVATFGLSGQLHLALGAIALALGYAAARFGRSSFAWTAAGVAVTVAVGLVLRFSVIEDAVLAETRTLEDVGAYSAEPIDFLDRFHGAPSEELVYLGWLTLGLALVGLVALARSEKSLAVALGLAALVPILLAFGTNLPLFELARVVVPPFENVRVPGRLMPVADVALAGLAAFGAAVALRRITGRRAQAAGGALLLLVLADLTIMPFSPTPGDPGNAAYAALAGANGGRVLELPFYEPGRNEGTVHDLYTLQAPRERPTGYSTLAPVSPFLFYYRYGRLSCGAWLPRDEDALERLGVESIVFHAGLYARGLPGGWFAWEALLDHGWRPVARGGSVSLFRKTAGPRAEPGYLEPPRSEPYLCRGWGAKRRTVEPFAPLWIYGGGELTLGLRSARPVEGILWVDGERERLFTVSGRDGLQLRLRGERWHPVVIEIPTLLQSGRPLGLRLARISFPWR